MFKMTTSEIVDQGSDNSASAVSDCYSNDEDYIDELCIDKSTDERIFKTNLFTDYKLKLDRAHRYAIKIESNLKQNKHSVEEALSNLEISSSKAARLNNSKKIDKKGQQSSSKDYSISTEFFKRVPVPKERLPDQNRSKVVDNFVKLGCESSLSVSNPCHVDISVIKDELVEQYENTYSNSLFDISRKSEDKYLNAKGDEMGSMTNGQNKSLFRKSFINDGTSSKYKNDIVHSGEGDFVLRNTSGIVNYGRKRISIKSISYCSKNDGIFIEQETQTTGAPTNEVIKGIGDQNIIKMTDLLQDSTTQHTQSNLDNSQNLTIADTLDILKMHVNTIISKMDSTHHSVIPLSAERNNTVADLFQSNTEQIHSDGTLEDLHIQIKHIYSLLDSKLNQNMKSRKKKTHRRRFSENIQNKMSVDDDDEIVNDQEVESTVYPTESQTVCKRINYYTNTTPINDEDQSTCRIFELNPYDDLIKSYQSQSDRRIKAVGNKMKCNILINGPICMFDSTNQCWNMRNKTAYRCSIRGSSKELVEKCLKCLQDTFPQSCLNEKRLNGKLEGKLYVQ